MNVLFFLVELSGGDQFVERWAFIPTRFSAHPEANAVTIFSSMFMHGSWLHSAAICFSEDFWRQCRRPVRPRQICDLFLARRDSGDFCATFRFPGIDHSQCWGLNRHRRGNRRLYFYVSAIASERACRPADRGSPCPLSCSVYGSRFSSCPQSAPSPPLTKAQVVSLIWPMSEVSWRVSP